MIKTYGDTIRVGVIGCGFFGGLHAGKYAEAATSELIGVTDLDQNAAQALAEKLGVEAFASPEEMIGKVDAVSITAPAAVHYQLAAQFLKAGINVLVEKPIALEVAHADELIKLANDQGLVLQVGHQERYVFEDFGMLSRDVAPKEIRARRAGPFTGRAMDVSAVFDLMIHDLDLIHQVNPANVEAIEATAKTVHGDFPDEVEANLTLEDGCKVSILASRIADERQRDMRLVYEDGVIEIDFINRTLENSTKADLNSVFDGDIIADPLGYGIRAFVEAVRLGQPPRVTGAEARRALDTALRITNSLGS